MVLTPYTRLLDERDNAIVMYVHVCVCACQRAACVRVCIQKSARRAVTEPLVAENRSWLVLKVISSSLTRYESFEVTRPLTTFRADMTPIRQK